MAQKTKLNPITLFLVLLLSVVAGYGAYSFMQKTASVNTSAENTRVVKQVAHRFENEIVELTSASLKDNLAKNFHRIQVSIQDGRIVGLDTYSFGEQALLTKALTSKKAISDFIVANKNISTSMVHKKYVYASAVRQGTYINLTYASIAALDKTLSQIIPSHININVISQHNNNLVNLMTFGEKKEHKGSVTAINVGNEWTMNSSYDVHAMIPPFIVGLITAGILFSIGFVVLLSRREELFEDLTRKGNSKSQNPEAQLKTFDSKATTDLQTPKNLENPDQHAVEEEAFGANMTSPDASLDSRTPNTVESITANQNMVANLDDLELEIKSDQPSDDTDSNTDDNIISFDSNTQIDTTAQDQAAQQTISSYKFDKNCPYRLYDIRSEADLLTDEFIRRFAVVYRQKLTKLDFSSVVIGRDTRATSSVIADKLIGVLTNLNIMVTDLGQITTPMLAYTIAKQQGNGIMVTASHCPSSFNGFKWFLDNMSPTVNEISTFKQLSSKVSGKKINEISLKKNLGLYKTLNPFKKYFREIEDDIMIVDELTVCIDCMHGATAAYAKTVFEELGSTVIVFNDNIDGDFHTGNPDPTEANRLSHLSKEVVDNKAHIGLAFDGDGDRLVVVDENGRVISSEQLLSIFANIVLETHQTETIILDNKCSNATVQNIAKAGGMSKVMPTGSNSMRNKLHADPSFAVLAGEYSGHFMFNDERFICQDDAMYAGLRLLEYLTQNDLSLSQAVNDLVSYHGTPDTYFDIADNTNPQDIVYAVQKAWMKKKNTSPELAQKFTINELDGFKLESLNAFGLIRASTTVNAVTLRFAAKDTSELKEIINIFYELSKPINVTLADTIVKLESTAS